MNKITIFKAVEIAKNHIERHHGGRIVETMVYQDGDTYIVRPVFADGFFVDAYVNAQTGSVQLGHGCMRY